MIEKVYSYLKTDEKKIEKILDDDHAAINHMCLPIGEGLPVHHANANVYLLIVRGTMTITLDDQEDHQYEEGQIVNVAYQTKMNIRNTTGGVLEFFVVKAPNPRDYQK